MLQTRCQGPSCFVDFQRTRAARQAAAREGQPELPNRRVPPTVRITSNGGGLLPTILPGPVSDPRKKIHIRLENNVYEIITTQNSLCHTQDR